MQKVIVEGTIEFQDADLELIEMELPIHTDLTKKEKGCIAFKVTKDKTVKNRFHVYEAFESAEAFELHQTRIKTSRWGAITKNAVRNYQVKHCKGKPCPLQQPAVCKAPLLRHPSNNSGPSV